MGIGLKMENNEKISVIMGIYNCEETLSEAIESILKQTYKNWELIMCDDGSKDSTFQVAEGYKNRYPEKIILLKNENNHGLNYTLNKCLQVATGTYIARMDGDDICVPTRFEKEIRVFEREPQIDIVSTDMGFFDETGVWGRVSHSEYPQKKDFLKGSPFCHAPCMVRKTVYDSVQGYSEERKLIRVEDYHLWVKMYAAGYTGKNIHEVLYYMRDDRKAYSRRKFKYRLNEAYVKCLAIKRLRLPIWGYIYAVRPIIVGMLPRFCYNILHKRNLSGRKEHL